MDYRKLQAIILAAGKSSRFNTVNTKLSYTICGQEMIVYPVKLFEKMGINYTLILGYQKETILNILEKHKKFVNYIEQTEQRGTGHAVLITKPIWQSEDILIINGDMPLVTEDIIKNLINKHNNTNATISFVVAKNSNPEFTDYARVIKQNNKIKIVEARDFNIDFTSNFNINLSDYNYINAGIYIIKKDFLDYWLPKLNSHENSGEIYITDLISVASQNNNHIETIEVDFDYIRGINTLKELSAVEQIKRTEIINYWMDSGVKFIIPQTVYVDLEVEIEPDTIISQSVQLFGNTKIGQSCKIEPFSVIYNSTIESFVTIKPYSVIYNSVIKSGAEIGPFAHIRKQSIIDQKAVIGNFVEVSNSIIGKETKSKHLAYLGNAKVGSNVNIGAGVITCNYNGINKNTTVIGDNAFIGTNSALIAPVIIGQESIVAAGSTISKDVPENALAISRSIQINKENYVSKLKERYKNSSNKQAEFNSQESL